MVLIPRRCPVSVEIHETGNPVAQSARDGIFGRCLRSSGNHDFPARLVLLHRPVRFDNLIDCEHLPDWHFCRAAFHHIYEILKRGRHEIFGATGIGPQADGGRNSTHRTEALELPAIADHARYDEKRWKILSRERDG